MPNDEPGGSRLEAGSSSAAAATLEMPVLVSDVTERELIARIHSQQAAPPEWMVVGIGDDAAVVEPVRNRLEVLSVDALVEGVHFDRAFTPPAAIGHRALAVNVSDLAAMGASPRLALVSLALPRSLPLHDFDEMIASLTASAARWRMTIAGGNLTRIDGPLVLDITVVGTVKRRQVLTRGGARPGDDLYVTGSIGAAAAGLQMLKARGTAPDRPTAGLSGAAHSCIDRFLYPEPRLRLGQLLGRNRAAGACMDLSDGLADAIHQLAEASGVGALIDADALPIAPDARRWFEAHGQDAVHESMIGGDDYELLFAVRPRLRRRLRAAEDHGDVPITRIGACTADRAVMVGGRQETPRLLPRGFTHFR
jgi:thiamine-monophosphate kinase